MYSPIETRSRLAKVEAEARELQIEIWRRRYELWNGNPPSNVVDVFEPGVALHFLNYKIENVQIIGEQNIDGVRSKVAGMIDNEKKLVTIAEGFSDTTKRFTAAHELAHAKLHQDMRTMHRDLPLEKSGVVRSWREVEANRFGSAYLMPRKHLEEQFQECFRLLEFELTEASAFALCGTNAHVVLSKFKDMRQLTRYIAGADRFNGRYFRPLCEQFKVSPLAMAIRLEELELVRWRN